MKHTHTRHLPWKWLAPLMISTLVAACGGGDPVLGIDGSGTTPVGTVSPVAPSGGFFVPLGAATTFGAFGGSAGITNAGVDTVVNGDIGTTATGATSLTGFHSPTPLCVYDETPLNVGNVVGRIVAAVPAPAGCIGEGTIETTAEATAALAAARLAFHTLAALPGGMDAGAGELGGLTLAPGIYKAAAGTFGIRNGDLTLDAQGNPNAVWVFQMAQSLTVGLAGAPRSVILAGGAKANNVYWQVGSAATINGASGGTMVGTIISQAGVTFSTAGTPPVTTLNGRALSLNASVTMVNTVINVPAL